MPIRLEPVTADNLDQVIAVDIRDDQRAFLDSESIAQFLGDAPLHPTFTPYALCDGDVVVGFASVGFEPSEPTRWWIPLIVIAYPYQGEGRGRAAMEALISHIRRDVPACRALGLAFKPANVVARGLYLSLGFVPAGEVDERGEVAAWLELSPLAESPG